MDINIEQGMKSEALRAAMSRVKDLIADAHLGNADDSRRRPESFA